MLRYLAKNCDRKSIVKVLQVAFQATKEKSEIIFELAGQYISF